MVDIFPTFVRDGSVVPSTTWWPPNGTATYVVRVDNTGSGTANAAILTVPAAAGLSKTSVTCTASGGAQCPGGLTVSQLEAGVAIPTLPANSHVLIRFEATVTAPLGGSVTATCRLTPPSTVYDHLPNDNSDTITHAVLMTSTDTVPNQHGGPPDSSAVAIDTMPAEGGRHTLSMLSCNLPGPVVQPPVATPVSVSLVWQHINGATYTVARKDMGVLTSTPLTAALYPAIVSFAHSAPLYHHTTYEYTVVARYGGGCGSTSVSFAPPRPPLPIGRVSRRPHTQLVELGFDTPDVGPAPTGILVLGPGLPPNGHDQPNSAEAPQFGSRFTLVFAPGPGNHTWILAPYWETPNGRMIDVDSGLRLTLTMP
jgi:hypothetical protein